MPGVACSESILKQSDCKFIILWTSPYSLLIPLFLDFLLSLTCSKAFRAKSCFELYFLNISFNSVIILECCQFIMVVLFRYSCVSFSEIFEILSSFIIELNRAFLCVIINIVFVFFANGNNKNTYFLINYFIDKTITTSS